MTARIVFAGLFVLAAAHTRADTTKAKPPVEPSVAERAFFDRLSALEKRLATAKAYSVAADTRWTITGGKKEQSGTSITSLLVEHPGKVAIRVGVAGEKAPQYAVASDGKSVTRVFVTADLYSVTPCDGSPLDDLQVDGVTLFSLRPTGVDFLARPHLSASLAAQVQVVEALGDSEGGKGKRTAFRVSKASGRVLVLKFDDAADGLPTEIVTTQEVAVGEKKKLVHTLKTTLKWNLAAKPTSDEFSLLPPPSAKKVDDLAEALFAPDLGELIGKPAPDATFTGTDGKPVKLSDLAGKPTVVYAWAIWAAPSVERLPGLAKFVDEYEKKGVNFLAVNVGDTAEAVKAFVTKAKYTGKVAFDPLGTGLGGLRAQSVPAVVVLDKEGKVFSYHRGAFDTADKVKADLDKLLK